MSKKRILRSLLILVTALGISALIAFVQIESYKKTVPAGSSSGRAATVAGTPVGGPFTLTDHKGQPFTDQNLRGKYALLYFGFTYCPAICPAELQKMNVALTQSGVATDKIQPVFITVDPERDTQDVLAKYVTQFNPALIGLTGTPEQIQAVLKAYKIYARKVEDPALSDYTMDHSSYIYFLDPDGNLLGLFGVSSTPSEIAAAIRAALD